VVMHDLGWKDRGIAWQWRRRLWASEEEMLGECRILLHNFSLQHNFIDRWQWRLDPSGGYSVRGLYQLLTTQEMHISDATSDLIWHKQVPLKVSIFSWRLLQNRLPSKDNLVARDIISHDSQLCMIVCGGFENRDCSTFGSFLPLLCFFVGFSSGVAWLISG